MPVQQRIASEGRLQVGWRCYVPQKGPSHWFQTESNPALLSQVRHHSSRPGGTGSNLFSFQPPPQGASLLFQQVAPQDTSSTCWTTMGGARGPLALTRADPGSPSRGRGGVGPSLPLSPFPPDVTQPRGRCSAPQPGAESVRRPRGLKPNQTAPHPRHYLTGELGGQ